MDGPVLKTVRKALDVVARIIDLLKAVVDFFDRDEE